uniref:Uncharacterized protein n=1 Tax=Escherichia phage fEgEco12 TaxID=3158837 RepID=A0AAU7PGR0_9CAUD
MTLTFLILGIPFAVVILVLLVMMVLNDNTTPPVMRNHEVRFSAQNNKYYIVNCLTCKEYKVTGKFGFTIYYKDRVEADMICQKLNTVE